ncbi:MAG: MarR family winged helix-turn-helix transcriptional regulator [Enterococcus sp.]
MEVLREIGTIARALDSLSNIEFKNMQLSRGQYLYLVRISENPGIIQEELSEMLKVDRATVSKAIQKLEKKEFVVRVNDENNKKIKRLYLTEQGQQLYPVIIRENIYSTKTALEGLDEKEVEQFLTTLVKVRKNISTDWDFVKKGNKRMY